MAAIPTILKGDTPAAIPISLAEGFDYAEATLHVRYMGVEKVFTGLVGGGSLSLQFTEEETSRFPVGAAQVVMWLVHPGGRIRTIPTDNVRIKVTDSASEVYNAQITLRPSTLPPDATESDTLGDLKAKYNALKATLAAGCAALCVLVSSAAGISGGNLNDIPGNAMVVTNVTFEGLAMLDDLPDMSNYVPTTRLVAGKPLTSNVTLGPADVGALPADGTAREAEYAYYANSADFAYYSDRASNANFAEEAEEANSVNWSNVSGRPQNIVTFDTTDEDKLDTAEKIVARARSEIEVKVSYLIEDRGTGFSYLIVATNGVLFAEKVEIVQ